MKPFSSSIILFFTIHAIFTSYVNSQSDSCSSNLNLNTILFDTKQLHCLQVWPSQSFILRYGQSASNANVWSFVLSAPSPNSFVAIGFSKTGNMVGSSAVVGWVDSTGSPFIKQYYLGATVANRVDPEQGNLTILGNTSAVVSRGSRIYLAFQLDTTAAGGGQPERRLLYSIGPDGFLPVGPGYRLMEHRSKISTSINYATGLSSSKRPYLKLRRSHGALNMLGWGMLMIIGAMVARYCRQWDPIWFYVHTGIQSLAFLLGVIGVLCGFLLDNRLSVNVSTHKGIGVFIFVLGCLQAMALLARPNKVSKNRKYWNWYHYSVGRTLLLFAIVNVFYGIHLADEVKGWTAGYAIVICILFLTCTGLEYRLWFKS